MKFIFTFLISALFISFVNANECDDWFNKLNIDPKDPECEMKCSVGSVNMGTFNCPMGCPKHCNAAKEEKKPKKNSDQCDESNYEKPDCCDLKSFAQEKRSENDNRCKAFANVLNEAIQDSHDQKNPARYMMENLRKVLIGDGLTSKNRSKGPCFAGNFKGSKGLKDEFRDNSDQIQHAFAGAYIGYKYGLFACKLIEIFVEDSEVDKKLYRATCPIGYSLLYSDNPDLNDFKDKLIETIGDATCAGE